MTPDELAKKLVWQFDLKHHGAMEEIAAQIREAVEEARFNGIQEAMNSERVLLAVKEIARKEAYADAAKIAETRLLDGSILPIRGEPTNTGAIIDAIKTLVAKQIRARAKELE